jgi:hypothetical protein
MYYFPDSQDYLSVAKWIRFGNESVSLQKRPYMYPIWIALSESIVPSYALWFIQMFAWIGSGILIFKIMKQLTKNNLFSLLSLVLFARNISLITYTYFALTEILTAFFLLLWLYFCLKATSRFKYSIYATFFSSVLSVIKPLYIYLVIFQICINCFLWIKRKTKIGKSIYFFLMISLFPTMIQLGIMKSKFDTFKLSNIDKLAINDYYFTRIAMQKTNMEYEDAKKFVYQNEEIFWYLVRNDTKTVLISFGVNILENLFSPPVALYYPTPKPSLIKKESKFNFYYYSFFFLFCLLSFLLFLLFPLCRDFFSITKMVVILFPISLVVLSSGLSYWQGDRLVVPIFPISIVFLFYLFFLFFKLIKSRSK